MDTPKTTVELKDFPGLVNRSDRHDLRPGTAQVQINATCVTEGDLIIRLGYRQVTFEQ